MLFSKRTSCALLCEVCNRVCSDPVTGRIITQTVEKQLYKGCFTAQSGEVVNIQPALL